jgi:hypothetical protein
MPAAVAVASPSPKAPLPTGSDWINILAVQWHNIRSRQRWFRLRHF